MNALAPREPASMGLLKTVYESQHLPGLFAGGTLTTRRSGRSGSSSGTARTMV